MQRVGNEIFCENNVNKRHTCCKGARWENSQRGLREARVTYVRPSVGEVRVNVGIRIRVVGGAMGFLRVTVHMSSLVVFLFSEQPPNRAWSHSTTTNVSGGAMVQR